MIYKGWKAFNVYWEKKNYNFYTEQTWEKPVIIRCARTVHSLDMTGVRRIVCDLVMNHPGLIQWIKA